MWGIESWPSVVVPFLRFVSSCWIVWNHVLLPRLVSIIILVVVNSWIYNLYPFLWNVVVSSIALLWLWLLRFLDFGFVDRISWLSSLWVELSWQNFASFWVGWEPSDFVYWERLARLLVDRFSSLRIETVWNRLIRNWV